jgi:hypothetical protein
MTTSRSNGRDDHGEQYIETDLFTLTSAMELKTSSDGWKGGSYGCKNLPINPEMTGLQTGEI